ncbi:MAG TPA: MarR family transcriptional regulator [Phytomonospora sp.]
MTDPEERLAEAGRLARLLIEIGEQSKADFAAIVGRLGLPGHLARAMVMLSTPAPMRDLAERLACDRSYITSLADQLDERGLVERVPGEDRRVKLLALTEAGVEMRDRISRAVGEENMIMRRLSDEERAVLGPLLERLHDPDAPRPGPENC